MIVLDYSIIDNNNIVYKTIYVIKFMTDKQEFLKLSGDLVAKLAEKEDLPFPTFDKIFIIGTVNKKDIFEIRFTKIIK